MANNLPDNLRPQPKPGIAEGNPVEGFVFHGPFDDYATSIEWATANCTKDWWNITIQPPGGADGN